MDKRKDKKRKHVKVRNAFALHAKQRKAVKFKHKTEPKAGTKNKQRDYLEEDDV